jgi:hypothetical protein
MGQLTGNQIKNSYDGLIKTTDNAAIGAVEKEITDGLGNVSNLKIGTTSSSFTGTLDLTGATVTGLPDVDTTYSISSVQDGANSDIKLVDDLGNSTKVTLVAGTNITLTNSGNDVTIDAAGGGGAAGLVNGTGANSLKQSDTLTSSPANASGNSSIAFGNGTLATGPESLAIGDFVTASAIGSAAIGQYAEASGIYSSAWGRTAYARADGSVAFGQQAGVLATEPGAVSMGRGVVAVKSDTTHVRELYIVAPEVGLGGNGITMLSPNGTAYLITVDNTGTLTSVLA